MARRNIMGLVLNLLIKSKIDEAIFNYKAGLYKEASKALSKAIQFLKEKEGI